MSRRWEPEGFATLEAWRQYHTPKHEHRPAPTRRDGDEPIPNCEMCGDTHWVLQYDFFLDGMVQGRCPACCDTTVRAQLSRWEDDHGNKVGPP